MLANAVVLISTRMYLTFRERKTFLRRKLVPARKWLEKLVSWVEKILLRNLAFAIALIATTKRSARSC